MERVAEELENAEGVDEGPTLSENKEKDNKDSRIEGDDTDEDTERV